MKILCPKCNKQVEVSDETFKFILDGIIDSCEDCVNFRKIPDEIYNGFINNKLSIYVPKSFGKEFAKFMIYKKIIWCSKRKIEINDLAFKTDTCFQHNYIYKRGLSHADLGWCCAENRKIYSYSEGKMIRV